MVDLYPPPPMRLQGVMFNYLSTRTTLRFIDYLTSLTATQIIERCIMRQLVNNRLECG
jgi:hypothetical protein